MMTALALCLHLFAARTPYARNGSLVQKCTAVGPGTTAATFVIGGFDAAHPQHVGAILRPVASDFDRLLAMVRKDPSKFLKTAPAPVVVASWTGTNTRMILILPDSGFTAVEDWAARLEDGCAARADLPVALDLLAHEKSNPAGVVDLQQLHVIGESIQQDNERIASYRPWAGEDFPDVCK
jgi:hypothetical protein